MPGFEHMAIPPHMQAHMQPRSPAGDERVALCLTLLVRRLWTSLDAACYLILCTLQQRASRCLPSVGHVKDGTELQHPVGSKTVSLSRSHQVTYACTSTHEVVGKCRLNDAEW